LGYLGRRMVGLITVSALVVLGLAACDSGNAEEPTTAQPTAAPTVALNLFLGIDPVEILERDRTFDSFVSAGAAFYHEGKYQESVAEFDRAADNNAYRYGRALRQGECLDGVRECPRKNKGL